jgi:hypothetical protein
VIDAKGQTWQPSGPEITWTGWRYVELPLEGNSTAHWGGPNDGVVHYPVHWNCYFLLDPLQREMAGEVWLAAPVVEY